MHVPNTRLHNWKIKNLKHWTRERRRRNTKICQLQLYERARVPLKWAVQCIMAHGSFDLPTFRNIIMWSLVVVGRCYCWCCCCYHFTFSLRFANKIHHKQTIGNIFGHLFLWFSSCVGCCRCCRQSAFADLLLSTTKRKKWIWFTIASLCIASNDIEIYS